MKKTFGLPHPENQSFAIVDYSPDGSRLLIESDKDLEYPNESYRDVEVTTLALSTGDTHWVNAWDVFGWRECDATVEPQGFAPDGQIILRARPSVMSVPRRPNCVAAAGLYKTDLISAVAQLPDDTKILRYGKKTSEGSQPCKTDPDIIDACFNVHGRLSAWNGSPTMRIWRTGTKRILGVRDDIMPEYVTRRMDWDRPRSCRKRAYPWLEKEFPFSSTRWEFD
jgi:hypothetical protein